MKKLLSKLSLLALFCLTTVALSAQTYNGGTWYSLYDDSESSKYTTTTANNNITIQSYSVFTPSTGALSFDTKMTKFVATNPGAYQILVGGQTVDVAKAQTSYTTKSTTIGTSLGALDFKLKYDYYNTARTVYIRNVKLPLAQHILLNDGQDSKSFGSVVVDAENIAIFAHGFHHGGVVSLPHQEAFPEEEMTGGELIEGLFDQFVVGFKEEFLKIGGIFAGSSGGGVDFI
jgi:hypothetical protein